MLTSKWSRGCVAVVPITFMLTLVLLPAGLSLAADEGASGDRQPVLKVVEKVPIEKVVWSYRPDAKGIRAIARTIGLSTEQPQDLEEQLDYRGTQRRYGQLRYGSENSRRVVIVVDDVGESNYDFYVDADRDRRITKRDMVEGTGRTRTCRLETEIIRGDQPWQETRQVTLRLSATRTRLSVATLGCIEGKIPWHSSEETQPSKLNVRRLDGNANGLFADSRDRVLVDINDDGQWDRVSEQLPHLPVQNIAGRRYAVRADRLGKRFSLDEITGIGQLQIVLAKLPESARVIAFEAMVFSDDGSAYSLKSLADPLTVPVGRYTLGSVTMTIDAEEKEPWHFVFSRNGSVKKDDWTHVAAAQTVSLEAVGKTRFDLGEERHVVAAPGDGVTVSPRLYTQAGLLINLSCRGRQMGSFDNGRLHNRCDIKLTSSQGDTLSAAQSGFS